jgi:hypothetical protein
MIDDDGDLQFATAATNVTVKRRIVFMSAS